MLIEPSRHKSDCVNFEWKYVNYENPLLEVSNYWNAGNKTFIAQCRRAETKDWFGRPVLYPCEQCPYYESAPYAAARFTIVDGSGVEITDLTVSDFTEAERMDNDSSTLQNLRIVSFVDYDEPPNAAIVCLCLDLGDSMADNLVPIQNSTSIWVDGMTSAPVIDLTSIISYDATPTVDTLMTDDAATLDAAIADLASGTGSVTYDAALQAVNYVAGYSSSGQKAVILVSDGVDVGSTATKDDVINAAVSAGIPVYTIGVYSRVLDPTTLMDIASGTGGSYIYASSPADLTYCLAAIQNAIHGGRYGVLWRSGLQPNQTGVCRLTATTGEYAEIRFRSSKTVFNYKNAPERNIPTRLF